MQPFYRILLFLWLLGISTLSLANVAAHVDRTNVALGESLTLTIDTPSNSAAPDLSLLEKAFQLYGTTQSSQMSVINGKLSALHQIIVTLIPKRVGKLTIPAITVGNTKTKPLTITVTKPTAKQMGGKESPLFLEASLSSQKTYINTPAIYTLKLYYATNIAGGTLSVPQSDAFSMVPYGKKISYSDTFHGRFYQIVEQRYLLTPTSSGVIEIKPSLFKGSITGNDQPDNFFGLATGKPIATGSNALTLTVNAIPKTISPLHWLPAAKVTLSNQWSSPLTQLKVGMPITRTVTVTAEGIQSQSLPTIDFPAPKGFNAYPDKPQISDEIVNNTLVAKKQYKIAYLPTQSGQLTFPSITLPWWNTKTNRAETAKLPAVKANVVANTVTVSQTIAPAAQKNTSVAAAVLTPKPITRIVVVKTAKYWQYATIGFAVLWILTLLLWWYVSKWRATKKPTTDLYHEQKEISHKKALKAANKCLQQACESNAPKLIQTALISWAKLFWHDETIYSLYSIRQHTNSSSLLNALEDLESALYGHKIYDADHKLWHEIEKLIIETNNNDVKQKIDLKQFYPDE